MAKFSVVNSDKMQCHSIRSFHFSFFNFIYHILSHFHLLRANTSNERFYLVQTLQLQMLLRCVFCFWFVNRQSGYEKNLAIHENYYYERTFHKENIFNTLTMTPQSNTSDTFMVPIASPSQTRKIYMNSTHWFVKEAVSASIFILMMSVFISSNANTGCYKVLKCNWVYDHESKPYPIFVLQ